MPHNLRDYLYRGLLISTPVLLIAGAITFWAAISFQGYIVALMALALAGCAFAAAREIKARLPNAGAPEGGEPQPDALKD